MTTQLIDLTGQRFGRWLVLARGMNTNRVKQGAAWLCRCDCGVERVVHGQLLRTAKSTSCGCRRNHGMSQTRVYEIWQGMLKRCYNKRCARYQDYGGRGIAVCEAWHSFENFYRDMGDPPDGHHIDRIDNDGDYEPGNCRWVSPAENNVNRRNNVRITINGETRTVTEWAQQFGIDPSIAFQRIYLGWDPKRAVSVKARRLQRRPSIAAVPTEF